MSVSSNGRYVVCDRCGVQADATVTLRPFHEDEKAAPRQRDDGWLFAASTGRWRHYCPSCLPVYLERLDDPASDEVKAHGA